MELRTYLQILIRRWWLALIPAIVVLGIGLGNVSPARAGLPGGHPLHGGLYTGDICHVLVRQVLFGVAGLGIYRLWAGRMGQDRRFCRRGKPRIAKAKRQTSRQHALAGRVATDVKRSMITMFLQGRDARQLEAIATAAITVMQTRNAQAFPQLGPNGAIVRAVDPPSVGDACRWGCALNSTCPIRVALALGVGIALVFLAHYFRRPKARPEICGRMTE